MSYKINFIGKELKEVNSREDANYHLAAKYGVSEYNKAIREKNIIFFKDHVLVRHYNLNEGSSYNHNKSNSSGE